MPVWIKKPTSRRTTFNDAQLLLAIACVRLGRVADASAHVGRMVKYSPAITLKKWRILDIF